MSLKPYNGNFDALTGSIFASWFVHGGPMAHAVGYVETSDRPWSLFYRWMSPGGGKTYVGAAVEAELSAVSEGFGEVFFNFMISVNNHFISTTEPFLAGAPVFIRTNGNRQVDAIMRWLIKFAPNLLDFDWGRERYLGQTHGVIGSSAEKFNEDYELYRPSSEAEFARWWSLVTEPAFIELSGLQFAESFGLVLLAGDATPTLTPSSRSSLITFTCRSRLPNSFTSFVEVMRGKQLEGLLGRWALSIGPSRSARIRIVSGVRWCILRCRITRVVSKMHQRFALDDEDSFSGDGHL
jgi:hypothetical protein